MLALGCVLEMPLSLWEQVGEREDRGDQRGLRSCLQAVSTLVVKTLVLHDVENQLGSGRRLLIACAGDTTSQLFLHPSQPFSVLGASC